MSVNGGNLTFQEYTQAGEYLPPRGDCLLFSEAYAVRGDCLLFQASSTPYTAPSGDSITFSQGIIPIQTSEPIGTGAATVSVDAQADLNFVWHGDTRVSVSASADLTINIELSAAAALGLHAEADLTIGYQVQGTTTENDAPVSRQLWVYDAATGEKIGAATSDSADGSYFVDLLGHKSEVYVMCLGSDVYGPLAHGPVTPDAR